MTNFSVKVVSDNVCPFCYLGLKRLETAIATYKSTSPTDTFTTIWSPFYLDPSASTTSRPIREALADKFGPGKVEAIHARLRSAGQQEGINFTFDGRTGNTRDSHRAVQLGREKGIQTEVVREVMRMYFEEGGDITKRDDLVKAMGKAGVEESEARGWLESGKGGEAVDKEVQEAYKMGVSGVPHFIVNGKYEVHGAEEVGAFLKAFAKAKAAA